MCLVPTMLQVPRSSSMLSHAQEMDMCPAHEAGVEVCSARKAAKMCLLPPTLQVAGSQQAQHAGAARDFSCVVLLDGLHETLGSRQHIHCPSS